MTEAQILKRIYPSVVTFLGDWRQMIEDIKRLKLTDISLFLTYVGREDREIIYQLLTAAKVKRIPHVHVRSDMVETELDLLVKKFQTKAFTTHYRYLKYFTKSKYRKQIFIENNDGPDRIVDLRQVQNFGGLCIDLSHYAEMRKYNQKDFLIARDGVEKLKFPVGCNHLSAILKNGHSRHLALDMKQLDYVTSIPQSYFSDNINIELANSIPQQLEFRKHLAKILSKQWQKKS